MTKEQKAFIQILADHINGRKTRIDEDLDWEIIYNYARTHQVSGMVCQQCENNIPHNLVDDFQKELMATLYYGSKRDKELQTIKLELNSEQIPFFIVKGPVVANLYPIPHLRTMGDIDLVIHNKDRGKCNRLLIARGYTCLSNQSEREWQYSKNILDLELHDRLVYEEAVNEKNQVSFFNDCWRYVKDGQLDWNFHLLFLIFHLRKHMMNSGIGFRYFLDLAVVTQHIDIDWDYVAKNLATMGMIDFARKCYGFIYNWFEIETPLVESIDKEFYEEATNRIFVDGVFGFNNPDNLHNVLINEVRKKKLPRVKMIRLALRKIFPSHKELENTEPYTYLNKNSFLLPFAWLHRTIRGIRRDKGETLLVSLKKSFIADENIERRNAMLKKWGL